MHAAQKSAKSDIYIGQEKARASFYLQSCFSVGEIRYHHLCSDIAYGAMESADTRIFFQKFGIPRARNPIDASSNNMSKGFLQEKQIMWPIHVQTMIDGQISNSYCEMRHFFSGSSTDLLLKLDLYRKYFRWYKIRTTT